MGVNKGSLLGGVMFSSCPVDCSDSSCVIHAPKSGEMLTFVLPKRNNGKQPYRCPICDGEGKVSKNSAFVGYEGDKCKACKGKCVLWG
jgi:hypothetical protein